MSQQEPPPPSYTTVYPELVTDTVIVGDANVDVALGISGKQLCVARGYHNWGKSTKYWAVGVAAMSLEKVDGSSVVRSKFSSGLEGEVHSPFGLPQQEAKCQDCQEEKTLPEIDNISPEERRRKDQAYRLGFAVGAISEVISHPIGHSS
ncbi:hypothetical protein HDU76_007447 [Blyttiomyces sp. JEL0837]|nr:hypothetical protein HDU76_007447 [Blyttiomyces sp. JEL0837]